MSPAEIDLLGRLISLLALASFSLMVTAMQMIGRKYR